MRDLLHQWFSSPSGSRSHSVIDDLPVAPRESRRIAACCPAIVGESPVDRPADILSVAVVVHWAERGGSTRTRQSGESAEW